MVKVNEIPQQSQVWTQITQSSSPHPPPVIQPLITDVNLLVELTGKTDAEQNLHSLSISAFFTVKIIYYSEEKITQKPLAVAGQEQEGLEANGILGACTVRQNCLPKAARWLEGNGSAPAACCPPPRGVTYTQKNLSGKAVRLASQQLNCRSKET